MLEVYSKGKTGYLLLHCSIITQNIFAFAQTFVKNLINCFKKSLRTTKSNLLFIINECLFDMPQAFQKYLAQNGKNLRSTSRKNNV